MPTYEQLKKMTQKYVSEFEPIFVNSPRKDGLLDAIEAHIAGTGETFEKFVLRAIRETMHRDQHPSNHMDDGTPPAIAEYLSSKKAGKENNNE